MPYDVQLVAGNLAGCGEIDTSQPLFTEEGGTYVTCIALRYICRTLICCVYTYLHCTEIPTVLAPTSAPHNVSVQRLPNGTAMNVSFIRLSIVEAQSVSVTYTVRYSLTAFRKRQSNVKDVIVPEEERHVVIRGLDRATPYHVIVEASNSHGMMSSSSVTTHPSKNLLHTEF